MKALKVVPNCHSSFQDISISCVAVNLLNQFHAIVLVQKDTSSFDTKLTFSF